MSVKIVCDWNMNDLRQKQLMEASWRRALTPEEESELQLHLASHPQKQEEWEDELALTAALHNLRDAPLSSNFTSQVLQAVDRDAARNAKSKATESASPAAWLRRLMPRFAFVAVTVLLMLTGLNAYRMHNRPNDLEIVKSLVSVAAPLESPAVFEDFDAIQQMRTVPEFNDQELVAVLLK